MQNFKMQFQVAFSSILIVNLEGHWNISVVIIVQTIQNLSCCPLACVNKGILLKTLINFIQISKHLLFQKIFQEILKLINQSEVV